MMNNLPPIPNQETRNRLLNNLKKTELELQEFGLELDDIQRILHRGKQQQKLKKVKDKLRVFPE